MRDVVIVGGGPGGIAAACTTAERKLDTLLLDESPRPGGQIWRHVTRQTLPLVARAWLHRLDKSGARMQSGASVIDIARTADGFALTVVIAGRADSHVVEARAVVIATGARERFIPFPGWTLPGVLGVGGGQALLKAGASMRGKRVIVAGSGPLLLPVAAALTQHGARVTHVIEQASLGSAMSFASGLWRSPRRAVQAAVYRARFIGARYMFGAWISSARGDNRVRGATVRSGDNLLELQCDILCAGYGLVPSTEVALLAGCMLRNDAVMVDENQCTSVDAMYAVGEATGVKGADAAIREGQLAGVSIANKPADAPRKTALRREIAKERAFAGRMDVAFRLREELQHVTTRDTIVCRCEDVGLGEIVRCGSMREAKLHTRAGMGPCQGRVCGPAMEFIMGWNETSVRPPVVPAPLSAFITDGAQ